MSEVTDLLSRLIQVDTTNPPGNETAAAELLREYLEASGVECELYARVAGAREPRRADPRHGRRAVAALLCHTDVVLADAGEWSVPPFSGEVRDGEVWGRGALDMKGQVAASAVAIASLAREGFEPAGDLIFARPPTRRSATVSGSRGSARRTPTRCAATTRSTRARGDRLELGGGVYYICSTAEKMTRRS